MVRLTAVSCLIVLLAACGSKPKGSLDCQADSVDIWRLKSKKAGTYAIVVDTRRDDTAFDPWADLYTVADWANSPADIEADAYIEGGDDDFDCTFPPPEFSCPSFSASVEEQEEDLLLIVGSFGSCSGDEGDYVIEATRDGKKVKTRYEGSVDFDDLLEAS